MDVVRRIEQVETMPDNKPHATPLEHAASRDHGLR